MSDSPPAPDSPDDRPEPMHGQVRHSNVSARVPESVGAGVFSNGVLILSGQFECVLDFVLRMGEVQKVVARVVLPPPVARQFEIALRENVKNYEERFGDVPALPKPKPQSADRLGDDEDDIPREPGNEEIAAATNQGVAAMGAPPPAPAPGIDDIYHDLKLPDEMLSGEYANAVLIRHSGTEFCFDFLTNVYPRSAVSSRVFVAAPHVPPFLDSLSRSLRPQNPPGPTQ